MSKHNELGKKGEAIAADFLQKKGHQIIVKNYRFGHKEIDIISSKQDILIFTEIKTRSSLHYGFPEEAVDKIKQNSIKNAADHFLEENPEFKKCRFDVISIVLSNDKIYELRHFKDAFY